MEFLREMDVAWAKMMLNDFRREAELEDSGTVSETFRDSDNAWRITAVCATGEIQLSEFLSDFPIEGRAERDWSTLTLMDLLNENLATGQGLSIEAISDGTGTAQALIFIGTSPAAIATLVRWFDLNADEEK